MQTSIQDSACAQDVEPHNLASKATKSSCHQLRKRCAINDLLLTGGCHLCKQAFKIVIVQKIKSYTKIASKKVTKSSCRQLRKQAKCLERRATQPSIEGNQEVLSPSTAR